MRITLLQRLGATTALIVLAGCSGGGSSASVPGPGSVGQSSVHRQLMGRSSSVLSPQAQLRIHLGPPQHFVSFNSCPATGPLVYMSDSHNGVINIYNKGTTLCGQIAGLPEVQGLTMSKHTLYAAVTLAGNIQAFRRGSTTPFKTLTDPGTPQYPVDVAIAPDGTVIASNIFTQAEAPGSLSTWRSSGAFVGNFALVNLSESFFITVFKATGIAYVDGLDNADRGGIWQIDCPNGACGSSTELGTPLVSPGGMDESNTTRLVVNDKGNDTSDTFDLPNMSPVTFASAGSDIGMALNKANNKWYSAEAETNLLVCYKYALNGTSPGSCGSVDGNTNGVSTGIAVDPASI